MVDLVNRADRHLRTGFFDAKDGLKLYCDWYLPRVMDTRAGVLLVHGYADHCGRYAELGERLAKLGFAVMAFDYRGHGQAGGRRGHVDGFHEYVADFATALARLRAGVPGRPLWAVCHSHGALIALRALCEPGRLAGDISALVLSSPYLGLALKVSPLKVGMAKLASRIAPRLSLKSEIDPKFLSHDPTMVERRKSDRFCHSVATARWFTEANAAQAFVLEHAHRLSIPSLWLVGGDDRLADVPTTKQVFERAGGDKKIIVYQDHFHEVFHEAERGRVFQDLESWVSPLFPTP